jgi:branched-chain amino acid transport system ATP-binding protein
MLSVKNIRVVYNDVVLVLRGISLEVGSGSIVTLLGSNGAGKTTILKAITGVLGIEDGEIEEGSIEFSGEKIHKKSPEKIVRMGICAVPEGRGIFSELTVLENLKLGSFSRKEQSQAKEDRNRALEYFPILRERGSQLAGYLSGGEQQMLAIGRSLMSRPKLMMLDEPSLGLAPIIVSEIFGIIKMINEEENVAILLIEQNAKIALDCAEYGYIMENGRIVMDAQCEVLNNDLDIKEFYLGLTGDSRRKNYAEVKHYKRRKRWLS